MRVQVKKWGNSAAVRIPAAVLQAANLRLDDEAEVREEGGRVVIEPARARVELAALLARITPENLHSEVDFGAPVGSELL